MMKKIYKYVFGFAIGLINSLVGACGGIISVILLKKMGLSDSRAHANAIGIILPLSIVSAIFYIYKGYTGLSEAIIYVPAGVIGAVAGSRLLVKLPDKMLRKIFAVFILWAGVRMIIR